MKTTKAKQRPRIRKAVPALRTRGVRHRMAIPEPKGIADLVEHIESDPQFILGRVVIETLICSSTATVETNSQDAEQRALADQVVRLWKETLPKAMDAFAFGRVAFEKRFGEAVNGLRCIEALDSLPFEQTTMVLDSEGRFAGLELSVEGRDPISLRSEEVWWCALDATPRSPHGRSRYLGAPLEVWKQREQLRKNRETYDRKFALGNRICRAPAEYPPTPSGKGDRGQIGNDGLPADPMADMLEKAALLESGGSICLPSATDAKGQPLFDISMDRTLSETAAPLEARQRELDRDALHSLGIPEKAITQSDGVGSHALGEVHMEVLAKRCEGILNQIASSFQRNVIDHILAVNFPADQRPTMNLLVSPIRDHLRQFASDLVKAIVANHDLPAIITDGILDLRALLRLAGLPVGCDDATKGSAE